MTNWLIDVANQKRGLSYLKHADNIKNHAVGIVSGQKQFFSQIDQPFRTHSAVDPRNAKLFNTDTGFGIGLSNGDNEIIRTLELDTIKNFLDSHDGTPFVALAYPFNSPDESVTNRHAIENSKYISTKYDPDTNVTNVIDIETGDILWNTPTKKDTILYFFAGKIDGVPNTYYLVLNSLRTEMFETLNDNESHTFETLDLGVGAIEDYLIMPTFENASLESEDIVLASDSVFYMDPYTRNEFYVEKGIDPANITFRCKASCKWEQVNSSKFKFSLEDKDSAIIVFEIKNNMFEIDPDLKIQRIFKVYKV